MNHARRWVLLIVCAFAGPASADPMFFGDCLRECGTSYLQCFAACRGSNGMCTADASQACIHEQDVCRNRCNALPVGPSQPTVSTGDDAEERARRAREAARQRAADEARARQERRDAEAARRATEQRRRQMRDLFRRSTPATQASPEVAALKSQCLAGNADACAQAQNPPPRQPPPSACDNSATDSCHAQCSRTADACEAPCEEISRRLLSGPGDPVELSKQWRTCNDACATAASACHKACPERCGSHTPAR